MTARALPPLSSASSASLPASTAISSAHLIDAKLKERNRVIAWAREGRITEEELDAQLSQVRAELSALEGEAKRVEAERERSESARAHLGDAESFPDELARRFPKGFRAVRPYLRLTPQPNK